MDRGLWVVDEKVTHMTSYRLATQAEIDAAASEQMRQDAAVGRAIRNMPDDYALVRSSELFDAEHPYACYPLDVNCNDVYINFRSATVSAALVAAGLIGEEK